MDIHDVLVICVNGAVRHLRKLQGKRCSISRGDLAAWKLQYQGLLQLIVPFLFRFTQAGSEVSALLGRMPSAVGYQPTLASEMGELQERITSTKDGSITSLLEFSNNFILVEHDFDKFEYLA